MVVLQLTSALLFSLLVRGAVFERVEDLPGLSYDFVIVGGGRLWSEKKKETRVDTDKQAALLAMLLPTD